MNTIHIFLIAIVVLQLVSIIIQTIPYWKPRIDEVDFSDDEYLYEDAVKLVRSNKMASTSLLQRRLRVGYSKAANLIDLLEERGVIGESRGSKPREVLEVEEN